MLGDAGTQNTDASYGGETGESAFSLQFYRNKVSEYQSVLTALDAGYQSALAALSVLPLDAPGAAELAESVAEFESKRDLLRATAEAINLGAAAVNAAGGRMPSLSLPATLGIAPAIPLAAIAAAGTAAVLISWGREWLRGLNERMKATLLIDSVPAEARAELARQVVAADQAVRVAENSGLAALAPYVKWGAVALAAYMIWRAFAGGQGSRRTDAD